MKSGKILEVMGKVILVGAAANLGALVVRKLVESTKSSPDFGDDYEDSYQAGVAACKVDEAEAKQALAVHTVDALKDISLELIQTLRLSNEELIDLHAELIDCITGTGRSCGDCYCNGCGFEDCEECCDDCGGCEGCGGCDGHENCDGCDGCEGCGGYDELCEEESEETEEPDATDDAGFSAYLSEEDIDE